jgi:biotin carboxylase
LSSRKTLLVLAASRYQLDAIATARRLGYRVVTVDNVPENPGHALADRAYDIDTTDAAAVFEVARAERIDGIIAPCTDVAVPTAATVAQRLGLPGPPPESARIVTSKLRFRRHLTDRGVRQPRAYAVTAARDPEPALFAQGPWIIKPDRSSGSKGVFILRSEADFLRVRGEALRYSPTGKAVLEEFLEGVQGTCEGVLREGRVVFRCITDRRTVDPPHTATSGHLVPSRLPPATQVRLVALLEEVWAGLGITEGPFDCDFIAEGSEIYLLEITPRLGGNSLAWLLRAALDIDLVAYSVRRACGDPAELPWRSEPAPTAVLILGAPRAGRLHYDASEFDALRRESWVLRLEMDLPAGTPVQPFIHGRHRVGEAIVLGANRDDLDSKVDELGRRLSVTAL